MPERVIAGKTALVTGAARGIGRATTEALLREGVRVVLADLDLALAERAATELGAIGPETRAVALDVRDRDAFAALVDDLERQGLPLDILINNAGIMPLGPFLDQDPRLDDRQIDINLRGVIHGMRAVMPGMLRRRRGHVVNIASVAGKVGVPYSEVYAATKHGVVGLTEAVRHEYQEAGLSFSYVMPSIVKTELTAGTKALRYPPPIEPEDVAAGVIFALRTGAVDVFVPRFARLSALLPALLPRVVVETVGRWFGIDRVFDGLDDAARAAYQARISR